MEEEKKENTDELVTNKTSEDSVIVFGEDSRPEPLITIKDNHVNVKTLKVSMSRKHRIIMFLDIWIVALVSGITVGMSMSNTLSQYVWIISTIGLFVLLFFIGKIVVDFQNWIFTMNAMQAQMGEWYMEDIIGICQDFIKAGTKLAVEEVEKAVEEKTRTEAQDANGESENP